jgi:mono/diheme cytochrome c family protein
VALVALGACGADPPEVAGGAPPTTVDPHAAEVYQRACAECHGDRGEGVERFGPPLDPAALVARFPSLEEQVAFVAAGGEGGMPRFAGRLDDASLAAAVDLTRTGLDALGPLPEQPDIDPAAIFAAACARCHGAEGQGDIGPRLTGGAAVERFPDVEEQVEWVTFGGADMPAFRGTLTDAQIRAVVDYTRTELG